MVQPGCRQIHADVRGEPDELCQELRPRCDAPLVDVEPDWVVCGRPFLTDRLVVLDGSSGGDDDPRQSDALGEVRPQDHHALLSGFREGFLGVFTRQTAQLGEPFRVARTRKDDSDAAPSPEGLSVFAFGVIRYDDAVAGDGMVVVDDDDITGGKEEIAVVSRESGAD